LEGQAVAHQALKRRHNSGTGNPGSSPAVLPVASQRKKATTRNAQPGLDRGSSRRPTGSTTRLIHLQETSTPGRAVGHRSWGTLKGRSEDVP
jgi:hypothetical protein